MDISFTISISNIDKIGMLVIKEHYGYINPVVSNNINENYAFGYDSDGKIYYTGLVDCLGNFYKLPIKSFYVQLHELHTNMFFLIIFNKSFNEFSSIQFINCNGINEFVKSINFLNILIENGLDINNVNKIIDLKSIRETFKQDFNKIINSLVVDFYSISVSRVGQDSLWFDEIEISNLPPSNYLRKVISKSSQYDDGSGSLEKDKISIVYGSESGAISVRPGKVKNEFPAEEKNVVKRIIISNFYKNYKEIDYFEYLISNKHS